MKYFITQKPDKTFRYIGLLEHKNNKGWSFVNFSKGTISPCIFKTEVEALRDLEQYKQDGRLLNYIEIPKREFYTDLASR